MADFLEDLLATIGPAILGKSKANKIAINLLVNKARSRPHPWSTRNHYISWAGLTDRTYNARLLPSWEWPDPAGPPAPGVVRPAEPDAVELVKLFLAETGKQRSCPKSTCLFPAFAQYLTDGFLRTQLDNVDAKENRRRTTSNHDIDQSPLYGRTERQTLALRKLSETPGERGRLDSQRIGQEEWPPFLYGADDKVKPRYLNPDGTALLDPPLGIKHTTPQMRQTLFAVGGDRVNAAPQTAMMNTLFLREHNRLAGVIERAHHAWNDEQVFQTARNVVIVMFIKIVVEEYINHINTTKFRFIADPKVAWEADWNRPNWMTSEFTLLYRWHSLVPEMVTWGGVQMPTAATLLNNTVLLAGGLANAFVDQSANHASELGLGNAVAVMAEAEGKAIGQGRENRLQGYAAYRRAMGLKVPKDFEELAGKPRDAADAVRKTRIVNGLKALYGSVERLEFYPGLFAENRADNGPLPPLVTAMVAMDAFSQALTNPLLSRHVWGNEENRLAAFTQDGIDAIEGTGTLRDIVERNVPQGALGGRFVGMTRPDWKRS